MVHTRLLREPGPVRQAAILVANAAGKAVLRVRVRGIPRVMSWTGPWVVGRGVRLVSTATGAKLCIDGRDYHSCMMFYGRFAPDLLGLLCGLVREGDNVLDVGAQLGYVSMALAGKVGVAGAVYAFEPDPVARERLEWAIRANGLPQIHVFPNALSDGTQEIDFHVSPVVGWSTAVSGTHHGDLDTIRVSATRLDDLANQGSIRRPLRLVKIDVEGHEAAVLDGMQNLLAEDNPIVIVEVNPVLLAPSGLTSVDLLNRLALYDYRLFRLDERRGIFAGGDPQLTPVLEGNVLDFCDVVAVPSSETLNPRWLQC